MNFELLYWHWIVFGIILVLFEIFVPSFTILWFGAAAIIVGLIQLVFPDILLPVQVILWTILSALLTWAWFKFIKPLSVDRTKAGLSQEAIVGEVGQVLSVPNGDKRGTLRFPAPVLGNDEWQFLLKTEDELQIGDRVRVSEVAGNTLVVVKH